MKNNFLNKCSDILNKYNFTKIDNKYVKNQTIVTKGSVINVNGQIIQQPDQKSDITYIVQFIDDNYCDDVEFVQIIFTVLINNQFNSEVWDSFYFLDFKNFEKMLITIFKL